MTPSVIDPGIAMRFILIALAIVAASVSTASAQSAPTPAVQPSAPAPAQQAAAPTPAQQWSMDHGHAEDAANSAKAAAAAAAAKAASEAAGAPASPGPSTSFVVNGSATIAAEPPRTTEQQKADALAQSAWQARCRPTVMVDREGLRRTRYAESDCDLSRYNSAGR
jgi:hypothetical protein